MLQVEHSLETSQAVWCSWSSVVWYIYHEQIEPMHFCEIQTCNAPIHQTIRVLSIGSMHLISFLCSLAGFSTLRCHTKNYFQLQLNINLPSNSHSTSISMLREPQITKFNLNFITVLSHLSIYVLFSSVKSGCDLACNAMYT